MYIDYNFNIENSKKSRINHPFRTLHTCYQEAVIEEKQIMVSLLYYYPENKYFTEFDT